MITGPTPAAATRALRDSLQRAASCVTTAVVIDRRDPLESELYLAVRLSTAFGGHLALSIRHFYDLTPARSHERRDRWQARTTAYYYTLDDADGREILAYHWHPAGRSPIVEPHLHLGAGAGTLRRELEKAHLATGIITPVAVLALLLDQFEIRPRRADWRAVLEHTQAALAIP